MYSANGRDKNYWKCLATIDDVLQIQRDMEKLVLLLSNNTNVAFNHSKIITTNSSYNKVYKTMTLQIIKYVNCCNINLMLSINIIYFNVLAIILYRQ